MRRLAATVSREIAEAVAMKEVQRRRRRDMQRLSLKKWGTCRSICEGRHLLNSAFSTNLVAERPRGQSLQLQCESAECLTKKRSLMESVAENC